MVKTIKKMKELVLEGHDSTITIMEWIKNHKEQAFGLDYTLVKFKNGMRDYLISRFCTGSTLNELFYIEDSECFHLDGMKRHYSHHCWWFEIDGSVYYLS
jgi:hypothetical protein